MAVFNFSALADGQSISVNPSQDVLNFDQTAIAAADIRVTIVGSNVQVSHLSSGKDVTLLNVNQFQLALIAAADLYDGRHLASSQQRISRSATAACRQEAGK